MAVFFSKYHLFVLKTVLIFDSTVPADKPDKQICVELLQILNGRSVVIETQ
jgi:hypothetical protein